MYDFAVTHGSVNRLNLVLMVVLIILWWEMVKLVWSARVH